MSVDFPAPLVPTTASTSPARTPTSTPQSAGTGGSGARAAVRPTAGRRTTPTPSVWTANPDPAPRLGGGPRQVRDRRRRAHHRGQSAVGTARGAGASTPGTQTPWAASSAARAASVGTTGPSAATRPVASRTTRRSTSPAHALEPVLDQHHGGSGAAYGVGDRPAYGRGGGGVEHRRRLVEQDEARTEREHPGEREALRLPAGERPDRVVDVVREARRGERAPDRRPDPVPRQPEVLGAERHVPAGLPGDRGVGRVLHEQAHARAAVAGGAPVDRDRAGELTGLGRGEDPGERAQQGRLARPARPGQQDALPGLQLQADAGQHGGSLARTAARSGRRRRRARRSGGAAQEPVGSPPQRAAADARASCPAGNASRAPARAR